MSLILEALRKLERDKQTPERGLLVTGATTWALAEQRRVARVAWVVLGGLCVALGIWLLRGRTAQAPSAPRHAAGAAPAQTPSLPPPPRPAALEAPQAAAPPLAEAATAAGPVTSVARGTGAAPTAPAAAPVDPFPAVPGEGAPASGLPGEPREAAPAAVRAEATPGAPAEPRVQLQAVSERDGRPIAIVNGRLVREGDRFDGITILRIGPAEVEVEIEGQRRVVTF